MSSGQRRGLHAHVVEVLGQRIVSGELPEDATVSVSDLEKELGISLTAVREALKVLGAKGLIDARPKRGTFVQPRVVWHLLDADIIRWRFTAPVDAGFLDQLHEVREIVEPAAARLAAARATSADLRQMQQALDAMAAASDPAGAVEADLAFHRAMLGAAHNELLAQMEVVIETGLAQRDRIVHGAAETSDALPSHRALLEAIRATDPAAAEIAARDLLRQARTDAARLSPDPHAEGDPA